MTVDNLWENFYNSGSVFDYLIYCQISEKKEQDNVEVHDRRIDNKRK